MFTGIIEETGTVAALVKGARSAKLTVKAAKIFEDLRLGDSVAVNGVCLTVAELGSASFTADVMNETLLRSSLGELRAGSGVNLERAMPANGRFGGHIVSGHIDGTGRIESTEREGNAVWIRISAAESIMRYIVEKGSVAIDGISLTVAKRDENGFSVSVIPHTGRETTLLGKGAGERVNLENDVIGKYVERLMSVKDAPGRRESGVTAELLVKAGFNI